MKYSILIALATHLILKSCSEPKKRNELDSDQFKTKEERIESLKKEIKWQSEFNNAEFELFNTNGFVNDRITLPGASSLDYKFVIKVDVSDVDKWTAGMIKTELNDTNNAWTKEIIEKRKMQWEAKSFPEFYMRAKENVKMIIYRTEGIVYKRVIRS